MDTVAYIQVKELRVACIPFVSLKHRDLILVFGLRILVF
jgi:hypothetical protein